MTFDRVLDAAMPALMGWLLGFCATFGALAVLR